MPGNATNFRLNIEVKFKVTTNNNLKDYKFTEKFDMKKGDTIFEGKIWE